MSGLVAARPRPPQRNQKKAPVAQRASDEDIAASFDAVAHVDSSVLLSKPVSPGLCDDVKQVMTQRRGPWCSQRHVCTLYCKH